MFREESWESQVNFLCLVLIVLSIASALIDISYEGDMGDESSYGGRSGWKFDNDNDNNNDDCYKNW